MDLAKTSCTYCQTVFPHHARAAQQVAVVNQMMADRNGNGIPDAFEGLIANAPHGQVHLIGVAPQVGPGGGLQVQTNLGAVPLGNPMAAYAAVHQQVHVANAVKRTTNMVMAIVIASLVMTFVIVAVVMGVVLFGVSR